MRVLLTDHFVPATSASDRYGRLLAGGLHRAGHDVRMLVVADRPQPAEPFSQRVVVCRANDPTADLPFGLPSFQADSPAALSYLDLSTDQLAAYREELRRQLDLEVAEFDPQIIHVQHIWIEGQLALETGVPYVLTGWEPELECRAADPRYRDLVDQAAENASRIVVASESLAGQIAAKFESIADRIVVVPEIVAKEGYGASDVLAGIYRDAFQQRFGRTP
jgi:glycogen(starch) synthase